MIPRSRSRSSLAFGLKVKSAYRPPVHYGEAHHAAKLTLTQVLEIAKSQVPQKIIAAWYGVHQSRVSRIRNQKAWRCTGDTGEKHEG